MSNLTNITCIDTGGHIISYSALYKGQYWICGMLCETMSAFSVDPLNTFDEDGYYVDPNEYEVEATDFPTWAEVMESITEDTCDYPDDAIADIKYYQVLTKPVNVE